MQTNPLNSPSTARLNPFAIPSSTTLRFILLIVAILAASIYIYQYMYLELPGKSQLTAMAIRDYSIVKSAHPTQSNVDLQANIAAEHRYLTPVDRNEALWIFGCLLLEVGLALIMFLILPIIRIKRRQLKPLATSNKPELIEYLNNLCNGLALERHPTFLWEPSRREKAGSAFGCFGKYYIVLSAGLIYQFGVDRDMFHATCLHEIAHIYNKDINKTYFTISIWWAFVIGALAPLAPVLLFNVYLDVVLLFTALVSAHIDVYFRAPVYHAGLNEGLRIIALTLLVYLSRNAVLRAREMYADVRGSVWDGRTERFVSILRSLPQQRGSRWFTLLHIHPAPQERINILGDSTKLLRANFWDVFGAGIAAMIAFPSFAEFFYLLHIPGSFGPGSFGGTGAAAVIGAGLVIGLLLAGIIQVAIFNTKLIEVVYGTKMQLIGRVSLALVLGMLLGQAISLEEFVLTLFFSYNQNVPSLLSFDTAWSISLFITVLLFMLWIETAAPAWLEFAATRRSPLPLYWMSVAITGSVFAIWIGLLYGIRFEMQATLPVGVDIYQLFNIVTQIPVFLFVFVALWVYPCIPLLWSRPTRVAEKSWVFQNPQQRLVLPFSSPLHLRRMLMLGGAGGSLFFLLDVCLRLIVHFTVPEVIQQGDTFYIVFGYVQVFLGITIQVFVAAIVAGMAHRSGIFQGLGAAFFAAIFMAIAYIVIGEIFSRAKPDLAALLIAISVMIGFFVTGGALFALPVVCIVALVVGKNRESKRSAYQAIRIETLPVLSLHQMQSAASKNLHRKALSLWSDKTRTPILIICVAMVILIGGCCAFFSFMTNPLLAASQIQQGVSTSVPLPVTPYAPYRGKLVLTAPLSSTSELPKRWWDTTPYCQFGNGVYHVIQNQLFPSLSVSQSVSKYDPVQISKASRFAFCVLIVVTSCHYNAD